MFSGGVLGKCIILVVILVKVGQPKHTKLSHTWSSRKLSGRGEGWRQVRRVQVSGRTGKCSSFCSFFLSFLFSSFFFFAAYLFSL